MVFPKYIPPYSSQKNKSFILSEPITHAISSLVASGRAKPLPLSSNPKRCGHGSSLEDDGWWTSKWINHLKAIVCSLAHFNTVSFKSSMRDDPSPRSEACNPWLWALSLSRLTTTELGAFLYRAFRGNRGAMYGSLFKKKPNREDPSTFLFKGKLGSVG